MRQRSLFRKLIKWIGVSCCVLIAAAWAGSMRWHFDWVSQKRVAGFRVAIMTFPGELSLGFDLGASQLTGLHVERITRFGPQRWWFHIEHIGTGHFVFMPIWALLAAAIALTLWCFSRDRSYPIGRCPTCGYSVQGATSNRCPECGELRKG